MKKLSLYIHIPFCDHKCIYCDFYSLISYKNINVFFAALEKEAEYYSAKYSNEYQIKTIFFGGGTPSFVDVIFLESTLKNLNDSFKISKDVEVTIETNPGTVNKQKLASFLDIGINRISVGIQSFNEDELKFLTRIHDPKTAAETVRHAYEVGFENTSVDLIFNLPGQSSEKWKSNLNKALELPVKHISAYSLILERGTILNKMVLDGKVKMQDIEIDANLYETTIEHLSAAGFKQYEVSNFAVPGFECRHNLTYWEHKEYVGLGTAAHSFVNGKRWWNYSSLKMYIAAIQEKGNAVRNEEILTASEMQDEYIMLNLRANGLSLYELSNLYGSAWIKRNEKFIRKLVNDKLLTSNNNFIKFTTRGYALCDEILAHFS